MAEVINPRRVRRPKKKALPRTQKAQTGSATLRLKRKAGGSKRRRALLGNKSSNNTPGFKQQTLTMIEQKKLELSKNMMLITQVQRKGYDKIFVASLEEDKPFLKTIHGKNNEELDKVASKIAEKLYAL